MRVFNVQPDGKFREYVKTPFHADHEEAVLEEWLESNTDGILEDSNVLIIGRQVLTDLGGFIDLLGLDRNGSTVVVELKRDRTPRDTLAQALEYASFMERLDSSQLESILQSYLNDESLNLAMYHRDYFQLSESDAVAFNKEQRIVIIGQRITSEIKQTAAYLCAKGLKVTCVEFTFFLSNDGMRLISQDIVVGGEYIKPKGITSGSLSPVSKEQFIASLDSNGKAFFSKLLEFAVEHSLPIHWGRKGFSLNINLHGNHIGMFFGYPPDSVFKQCIRTLLSDKCGISGKTGLTDDIIKSLRDMAEQTGLFVSAGRELKCMIDREFSESEISIFLDWCRAMEKAVIECDLKE